LRYGLFLWGSDSESASIFGLHKGLSGVINNIGGTLPVGSILKLQAYLQCLTYVLREMVCYTMKINAENLEQNAEDHKYASLCSVL
jgi:hypothetical protein